MRRYADAAILSELAELRRTVPGNRARATFKAAAAIGNFVAAGAFTLGDAESMLLEAAAQTGLPERTARDNVRRGLAYGMETPRGSPRQPPADARRHVESQKDHRGYPPETELAALWSACLSAADDEEAAAWLMARAIDPVAVELWDLARVLPRGGSLLPRWAHSRGGTWAATGHRLIVPLFDCRGRLASVRARAVRAAEPKELAPAGYSAGGVVMSDAVGRQLLAGVVPDWWRHEVVVQEGVPDFLTRSSRQPDSREQGPAVFGITAGAWTKEIADRIPSGAFVVLRTHHDSAGGDYSRHVAQTVAGRVELFRARRDR